MEVWKKGKLKDGSRVLIKLKLFEHTRIYFDTLEGKHRCDKALVCGIYSLRGQRLYSDPTAYGLWVGHIGPRRAFPYTVGKIVKPRQPFSYSNTVCASGIHFFLTRTKALRFRF